MKLLTITTIAATILLAVPVLAMHHGSQPHGMRGDEAQARHGHHSEAPREDMRGAGGAHGHGADGTGHDEVNMPGLRGRDATPEENAELATMFRNFPDIYREVTNLPNGIRTVTWSNDPELMDVVTSHVVGMIGRVEDGRDPEVIIQSPTLDILFERRDRIETVIETTRDGIVVIQTSDDPEVVEALHTHAAEVSDMVDRGMAAVHDAMQQRTGR